jgi:hypothetical protein
MYSQQPLAMIGEGGFEEVLQNQPGRIQITPTNDQITMGRELPMQANPMAQQRAFGQQGMAMMPDREMPAYRRIGNYPLGRRVPGFQYGGSWTTGSSGGANTLWSDPFYDPYRGGDPAYGFYGNPPPVNPYVGGYAPLTPEQSTAESLSGIYNLLRSGASTAPRTTSTRTGTTSSPTNTEQLRAYYNQALANLATEESELAALRAQYEPIPGMETSQLAIRNAEQARVQGLQPIADANLLYRFGRAGIEDPLSRAARQIGVTESARRLALQGLTLPYEQLRQAQDFNESARRLAEERLRIQAAVAGLAG